MVDLASEAPFELGALRVYPAARQVLIGDRSLSVEPRVMQVLVVLARNRGGVTARLSLMQQCWEGATVGEEALNRCIAAIRRLCEANGGPTITTVARVGYRLDAPPSTPPRARSRTPAPSAATHERRPLTALSCVLHYPSLTARPDPEEWHAAVTSYRAAVSETVQRLGGRVAHGHGAQLVAYFGFPSAAEDAPERAIRAALAIVATVTDARVGVHSGLVVASHGGDDDPELVGEAIDIAVRVRERAPRGTVLMTSVVRELVQGVVADEGHGVLDLEGVGQPYALHRARSIATRSGTRKLRGHQLTPFVGREDELSLLLGRLQRAQQGQGQVVFVTGEPGIGKTRIVRELKARAHGMHHYWLVGAGSALSASSPFHAVTQLLRLALELSGKLHERRGAAPHAISKLERALSDAGVELEQAVPLIAELLHLPIPDGYPPVLLAPGQQRKRLFAALLAWLFGTAEQTPLVLVLEDLHWLDPSSLELVQMLIDQVATSRLLLICTFRPDFRSPWSPRTHHTYLKLDRLNARETRELVAGVTLTRPLSPREADAVIERSDGVPIFAEALTRGMLDRSDPHSALEIPFTLRDSLAARLDRLGTAKAVAQLSAVIGRDFSYEVLAALSPLPEAELQAALGALAEAELIYEHGVPPDASYEFRHALFQSAAYDSLVKADRRALHARTAELLIERSAAIAATHPELLARHWAGAGETERAVAAWTQVATTAKGRHAYKEAEEGYRQALALLTTLPDAPARDAREIELVSGLGAVLQRSYGEASAEAVATLLRCRTLAENAGTLGDQVAALLQACSQAVVAGDLRYAAQLADQLLPLAQREGSDESLASAHQSRFLVAYYLCDLANAEHHFALWRAILERGRFAHGYRVLDALLYAGHRALIGGRFELASERLAAARAYVRTTNDPLEIVAVANYESLVHCNIGDPLLAESLALAGLTAAERLGVRVLGAVSRSALGWSRSLCGRTQGASDLVRQGIAELVACDQRFMVAPFLMILSEVQLRSGQLDDALVSAEQALAFNPEQLPYRANGLQMRGNVRRARGEHELALADFTAAISFAQQTHETLYELLAATGAARLFIERGDARAARAALAPLYEAFTECHDTRPGREAKAVLDGLDRRSPSGTRILAVHGEP